MPKFGTKNALFEYLWAGTWKWYCHLLNQHPRIYLIAKFREIIKIPKVGTKNAWFGYFWAGIWKQYFHIWNKHRRICLIAKFRKKSKLPEFGTKIAYLGSLGYNFKSTIVIFEISTLKFV